MDVVRTQQHVGDNTLWEIKKYTTLYYLPVPHILFPRGMSDDSFKRISQWEGWSSLTHNCQKGPKSHYFTHRQIKSLIGNWWCSALCRIWAYPARLTSFCDCRAEEFLLRCSMPPQLLCSCPGLSALAEVVPWLLLPQVRAPSPMPVEAGQSIGMWKATVKAQSICQAWVDTNLAITLML